MIFFTLYYLQKAKIIIKQFKKTAHIKDCAFAFLNSDIDSHNEFMHTLIYMYRFKPQEIDEEIVLTTIELTLTPVEENLQLWNRKDLKK